MSCHITSSVVQNSGGISERLSTFDGPATIRVVELRQHCRIAADAEEDAA